MVESSRPAYTGLKDSVSEKENSRKEKKIPPLHSQLCVSFPRKGSWEAVLTLCLAHGDSALYPNVGAARPWSSELGASIADYTDSPGPKGDPLIQGGWELNPACCLSVVR